MEIQLALILLNQKLGNAVAFKFCPKGLNQGASHFQVVVHSVVKAAFGVNFVCHNFTDFTAEILQRNSVLLTVRSHLLRGFTADFKWNLGPVTSILKKCFNKDQMLFLTPEVTVSFSILRCDSFCLFKLTYFKHHVLIKRIFFMENECVSFEFLQYYF